MTDIAPQEPWDDDDIYDRTGKVSWWSDPQQSESIMAEGEAHEILFAMRDAWQADHDAQAARISELEVRVVQQSGMIHQMADIDMEVQEQTIDELRAEVERLLWILESDTQVTVMGLSDFIAKYGDNGDSAAFIEKFKQDHEGLTAFGQTSAKEARQMDKILSGVKLHLSHAKKEGAP